VQYGIHHPGTVKFMITRPMRGQDNQIMGCTEKTVQVYLVSNPMVGFAPADGLEAVQLFQQDQGGQFMLQGKD
jgi:hypothetical protein